MEENIVNIKDYEKPTEETKEVGNFLANVAFQNDKFLKILENAGINLDKKCPDITEFSIKEIVEITMNEIFAELGIPESTLDRKIRNYDESDLEVFANMVDAIDPELGKSFREKVVNKWEMLKTPNND